MDLSSPISQFKAMHQQRVYIDPLLVQSCVPLELQGIRELASQLAAELSEQLELAEQRHQRHILGLLPYSSTLMKGAIEDTILSTAVSIVYDELGVSLPRVADIARAYERVSNWTSEIGLSWLYMLYLIIVGNDILQPLIYLKTVSESDFLGGMIHHPYSLGRLDLLLLYGLAHGMFRLKIQGGERRVQVTRLGAASYTDVHRLLVDSGYIERRVEMSYLYLFGVGRTRDHSATYVWPGTDDLRIEFVQWLDLPEHASVLEVEYGRGQLTFPNDTFDAVVGSLQTSSSLESLVEMRRVVKPGGMVGVLQCIGFPLHQPFLKTWFEPLVDLARRHNVPSLHNRFPTCADLIQRFETAGMKDIVCHDAVAPWVFNNPEADLQKLFRFMSWFRTEFLEIPWTHRQSLVDELLDRGRDMYRKYQVADRTVNVPAVFIRGRVV